MTMYIMASLLVVAFFSNLAVKPVNDRFAEGLEPAPPPRALAAS